MRDEQQYKLKERELFEKMQDLLDDEHIREKIDELEAKTRQER